MFYTFIKALSICFFFAWLVACAPSHVIRHTEALSRDYTYIDFSRNPKPFQHQDIVGGEHESLFKVLGFQGERFSVVLKSIDGEIMYFVDGDQILISNYFDSAEQKERGEEVEIIGQDSWFIISVYAHPYAEYLLTVTKL
ncbi:hypothetical protein MD588_23255 [Photobacterium sp. SDRW27]|uniref:hypothetical protein n=1 Tax=Photobacterium obscurum TaxID=2829490 RepID=UPI00224433F7|nr:hypothetical protein [Photobacterium obscurum]MCW8331722.1 hypothetical protein [Photobacterium obscurum]